MKMDKCRKDGFNMENNNITLKGILNNMQQILNRLDDLSERVKRIEESKLTSVTREIVYRNMGHNGHCTYEFGPSGNGHCS